MRPRAAVARPDAPNPVTVEFSSLDDFHPTRSSSAWKLPGTAHEPARLKDPATFGEEAAALLRAGEAWPAASLVAATGRSQSDEQGDLLERLLGSATRATSRPSAASVTDTLVASLVAPHVVRGPDPSLAPTSQRSTPQRQH